MPATPSDRPSIAEIAAFTRRLRDLTHAGRDADPAERERFLADKRALLDRIAATDHAATDADKAADAADDVERLRVHDVVRDLDQHGADPWDDYRVYTPAEAAAELIARGIPPDQAPGMVDRYVDAMTWDRGWSPQDQWQIDDDDLAEMTSPHDDERPGPAETWAPLAAPAETAATQATARDAEAELQRRAQLARWDHTDATTDADVDEAANEQTRVIEVCNPIPGEEPTS